MGVSGITQTAAQGHAMTVFHDGPLISVIIPTRNRSASLRRTLDALCAQTYPAHLIEVLVVTDGCDDGTVDMLARYPAAYSLRVIVITPPSQGPAAARNRGAERATGSLLLFLDDDVEPQPPLLDAHVHAHNGRRGRVVIGPYPPALQGRAGLLHVVKRAWWGEKFRMMLRPGHRYTYGDLLGGNVSLETELFERVGGFDPAFPCAHEDYELGARLIKANASLTLAPNALAYHHEHEHADLDHSMQRACLEGRADVLLGRRHPELRPTLPLVRFRERIGVLSHIVHALAYDHPRLGTRLASLLRLTLGPLECVRLRRLWRKIYTGLRHYWYLRGVAEELGSPGALADFLQDGPSRGDLNGRQVEIDLEEGVEAAERLLDRVRPAGACLRYGTRIIGRIPPQAGAELLRGPHLRPILVTDLAWPLVKAIATKAAIGKNGLAPPLPPANHVAPSMGIVYADESH